MDKDYEESLLGPEKSRKTISVAIPKRQYQRMKQLAGITGTSVDALATLAFQTLLHNATLYIHLSDMLDGPPDDEGDGDG